MHCKFIILDTRGNEQFIETEEDLSNIIQHTYAKFSTVLEELETQGEAIVETERGQIKIELYVNDN